MLNFKEILWTRLHLAWSTFMHSIIEKQLDYPMITIDGDIDQIDTKSLVKKIESIFGKSHLSYSSILYNKPIVTRNKNKDSVSDVVYKEINDYQYYTGLISIAFATIQKTHSIWNSPESMANSFCNWYKDWVSISGESKTIDLSGDDIDNYDICGSNWIDSIIYESNGTIQIQLKNQFLLHNMYQMVSNSYQLETDDPEVIVVDFSSPNIAKKMHIGHLRSTIIGDVIARYFEFKGHQVKRINHLGDWGRPFGMIITYIDWHPEVTQQSLDDEKLQEIYVLATEKFKTDHKFELEVYKNTALLQKKNAKIYKLWHDICYISRRSYQEIYDKLDIKIEDMGESFYQDHMKDMIDDLTKDNMLQEINGMDVVKISSITNPFILQKSALKGGNYTYDTSDLAALRYRLNTLKANRIYYVVDTGQSNHFELLFKVAEKVGYYNPKKTILKHVKFGLILLPEGGKISTRKQKKSDAKDNAKDVEAVTVGLVDIIKEGEELALDRTIKNNDSRDLNDPYRLTDSEIDDISVKLNVNCLKYFDLSHSRTSNYKLSMANIFKDKGNTAIYINYAYARMYQLWSRYQKIYPDMTVAQLIKFSITESDSYNMEPIEVKLLSTILSFPEVLNDMEQKLSPHILTDYMYSIVSIFSKFYSDKYCRCFQLRPDCDESSDPNDINNLLIIYYNRILLVFSLLKLMDTLLHLLGIEVIQKL